MSWYTQDKTKSTLNLNKPTTDVNVSAQLMNIAGLEFGNKLNDATFANKFFHRWCEIARKDLQKYAKENLTNWYKGASKSDGKKIPLKSKYKIHGKYAELYIWSSPTNYVFHIGKSNVPSKWIKFKKKDKRKPVKGASGQWFRPKKYKKDIKDIDTQVTDTLTDRPKRYFTSKTSHNKTRNYKLPFVWYQTYNNEVKALELRMQVADEVMQRDTDVRQIVKDAFAKAIDAVK